MTKKTLKLSLAMAVLALGASQSALADFVQITFSGTVTDFRNGNGTLNTTTSTMPSSMLPAALDNTFSITYTIDTSVADSAGNASIGSYSGSLSNVSVVINGATFNMPTAGFASHHAVENTGTGDGDNVSYRAIADRPQGQNFSAEVFLSDTMADVDNPLSNDGLVAEALAGGGYLQFGSRWLAFCIGPSNSVTGNNPCGVDRGNPSPYDYVFGNITNVSVTAVPLPAAA